MPQFILKIDLGNDAMKYPPHIALALHNIARDIEYTPMDQIGEHIWDRNGNSVGHYEVVPE